MKYQDIHYEQQMEIYSEYEDVHEHKQNTKTQTQIHKEQLGQMKDHMEQNCSIILEQMVSIRCFSDITHIVTNLYRRQVNSLPLLSMHMIKEHLTSMGFLMTSSKYLMTSPDGIMG